VTDTIETTPKVTVSFERKQNLGDYNQVTASAYLTIPVETSDPETLTNTLGTAFQQVKAAVYDELGIEVLIDEAGVVREKHNPVTVTRTEQRLGQEFGATPATGGGNFFLHGIECANPADIKEDFPQWLADECAKYGITKVWVKQGQYGQFYKEFVSKDGEPKLGRDSQGRTKIISKPKRDNDSF
jgi:acetylornithine deacetylase/succinyl-diaminopimelate desuccinylase-like protein